MTGEEKDGWKTLAVKTGENPMVQFLRPYKDPKKRRNLCIQCWCLIHCPLPSLVSLSDAATICSSSFVISYHLKHISICEVSVSLIHHRCCQVLVLGFGKVTQVTDLTRQTENRFGFQTTDKRVMLEREREREVVSNNWIMYT